jgi:chemotaxis protein CheD
MNNRITIGIGDFAVAKAPKTLYTSSLGSCLAVVLYEPNLKTAGMAHILLPYHQQYKDKSNPAKFADTAVELLVGELKKLGASQGNLRAKIAGGSKLGNLMPKDDIFKVGEKNVKAVVLELSKYKIPIESKDILGDCYRTVEFNIYEGNLQIKRNGNEIIYI